MWYDTCSIQICPLLAVAWGQAIYLCRIAKWLAYFEIGDEIGAVIGVLLLIWLETAGLAAHY